MEKSVNKPYIKQYNEEGKLTNPIAKSYVSVGTNRKQRRFKEPRFLGNQKGINLTVINNGSSSSKYVRCVQQVPVYEQIELDPIVQQILGITHRSGKLIGFKQVKHYIQK